MNCIETLLEIQKKYPNRVFLIDSVDGESFTFARMHKEASAVAGYLRSHGFQKGDRIGLLLCNSSEFAVVYLGCLYAGVITVPVNPILNRQDINFILQNSQCKQIIVSAETIECLDQEAILS